MAYAALANTDYSVGLYTAIFPVFVYLFFGPSRHISFGTNPLTSMMVGMSHSSNSVKLENSYLTDKVDFLFSFSVKYEFLYFKNGAERHMYLVFLYTP